MVPTNTPGAGSIIHRVSACLMLGGTAVSTKVAFTVLGQASAA